MITQHEDWTINMKTKMESETHINLGLGNQRRKRSSQFLRPLKARGLRSTLFPELSNKVQVDFSIFVESRTHVLQSNSIKYSSFNVRAKDMHFVILDTHLVEDNSYLLH